MRLCPDLLTELLLDGVCKGELDIDGQLFVSLPEGQEYHLVFEHVERGRYIVERWDNNRDVMPNALQSCEECTALCRTHRFEREVRRYRLSS